MAAKKGAIGVVPSIVGIQNLVEIAFEINKFSISAKIQDGGRKSEKSKFFRGESGSVPSNLLVLNLPEMALSLTVFEE